MDGERSGNLATCNCAAAGAAHHHRGIYTMRVTRVLRAIGLLLPVLAISMAIAAGSSYAGNSGHPVNEDCPGATNGMGCGAGSGNCGNNQGQGNNNGHDQGFGNNSDGCGTNECTSNCTPVVTD